MSNWWTRTDTGYCAEASDLTFRFECPACQVVLFKSYFDQKRNGEGELTHWQGECGRCHVPLTIFND